MVGRMTMVRFVLKNKTAGSLRCRPFASLHGPRNLPVPAVESASAMEPATTVEARSAMGDRATVETANRTVSSISGSADSYSAGTAVESGVAVESATAVEAWASIKSTVEPRAGADEETA